MGQLILVSGENSSGKSSYAEKIAELAGEKRFYIATMIPQTEENRVRIEKHLRQRAGLNFHTLECPYAVSECAVPSDAVVLLEDVSNLLSNVVFEKGEDGEAVFSDICKLQEQCETLIAVTIADLDPSPYEGETRAYIDALNRLNQKLSERADVDIRMVSGKPVFRKGDLSHAD